jgi:hypothetical protein
MDVVRKLGIVVELKNGELVARGLKEIGAAGDGAKKSAEGLTGALGGISSSLKSMIGATAILGGVSLAFYKMVQATKEQQAALAQVEAAVKSTGQAAGFSVTQLAGMASQLQKVSTFGDEVVSRAQAILLTFTQIKGDNFRDATAAVVDLATRMQSDLPSAAVQIGKALQDPVNGMTALKRVGVSFSESQKTVIETLVRTNHLADAQGIILKELQTEFGGSAAAARETLGGALKALSNAWADVFEVSKNATSGMVRGINAVEDALPAVREGLNTFFTTFESRAVEASVAWQKFLNVFHREAGLNEALDKWKKEALLQINDPELFEALRKASEPTSAKNTAAKSAGGTSLAAAVTELIAVQTAELEKQRALNAAYRESELSLRFLAIAYDTVEKQRRFAIDHTAAEIDAYNAASDAMKRAQIEGARLADLAPMVREYADSLERLSRIKPPSISNLGAQSTGSSSVFPRRFEPAYVDPEASARKYASELRRAHDEAGATAFAISRSVTAALDLVDAFGELDRNLGSIIGGLGDMFAAVKPIENAVRNLSRPDPNDPKRMVGSAVDVFAAALPVIGGLTAAVGGIVDFASQEKETARLFDAAVKAFRQSVDQWAADNRGQGAAAVLQLQMRRDDRLNTGLGLGFGGLGLGALDPSRRGDVRQSVTAEIDALFAASIQRLLADLRADVGDGMNALLGPQGEYLNQLNAITRAYAASIEKAQALGASQEDVARIEALRVGQIEALIIAQSRLAEISDSLLNRWASLTGATRDAGDPFLSLRKAIDDATGQGLGDLAQRLTVELRLDERFKAYLDGIDATNRRIAQETEQANFFNQIQTALAQQQLQVSQASLNVQQQLADGLRQTVDALRKYSDSIKLSSNSPLSSYQRYKTAEDQFEALVRKAFSGDQEAARAITSGGGDAFIQESVARFGTSARRTQDYNRVQSVVSGLEGMYGTQLEKQDKVLEELKKQTALATAQLDTSKTSLVRQLVDRANMSVNPTEIAAIRAQLQTMGLTIAQEQTFANGIGTMGGAFILQSYLRGGNQAGEGNTGPGSTIYNPAIRDISIITARIRSAIRTGLRRGIPRLHAAVSTAAECDSSASMVRARAHRAVTHHDVAGDRRRIRRRGASHRSTRARAHKASRRSRTNPRSGPAYGRQNRRRLTPSLKQNRPSASRRWSDHNSVYNRSRFPEGIMREKLRNSNDEKP